MDIFMFYTCLHKYILKESDLVSYFDNIIVIIIIFLWSDKPGLKVTNLYNI